MLQRHQSLPSCGVGFAYPALAGLAVCSLAVLLWHRWQSYMLRGWFGLTISRSRGQRESEPNSTALRHPRSAPNPVRHSHCIDPPLSSQAHRPSPDSLEYFMRPSAFVPHAHLRSPSLFPSKSPQLNQHDLVPRIPALAAFISYCTTHKVGHILLSLCPSWMRSVPWSLSIYCYSRSLVPQWSPKPDGDVTSFSHPSVQYTHFPISYHTLLRIF